MTYEESLAFIASLEPRGWRLGLDRMQAFLEFAGLEPFLGGGDGPNFVHVAGTNGKGSVTAFLQSMLVEGGYRTGAFFSPFVVDPRERVQIGRDLIGKGSFAEIATHLRALVERFGETSFGGITEFEFKTAMGFEAWRRANCEWVACEVGLGGRLDATNVLRPAACAIVSIGLDHTHILGDTREKIAAEKAGILKPGVAAVIGPMEEGPMETIERIAAERECPLWRMGMEVTVAPRGREFVVTTPRSQACLRPSLVGELQSINSAIAYSALELAGVRLSATAAAQGVAQAFLPARFQRVTTPEGLLILDGAHNTDSARVLRQTLIAEYPERSRWPIVFGMVRGHDPMAVWDELRPVAGPLYLVPIDSPRTYAPGELQAELGGIGLAVGSVREALTLAREGRGGAVVTGSFYLCGEVLRLLEPTG